MKFPFLKFKKDETPPLLSLRPAIFNVEARWYAILALFFIVLFAVIFVGFRFFHLVYFETYKKEVPSENFANLINVARLKAVIEKRNAFINQEIVLPGDPAK